MNERSVGRVFEKDWKLLLGSSCLCSSCPERRSSSQKSRKSICFGQRTPEFWFQLCHLLWTSHSFFLCFSLLHCKAEIMRIGDKVWKVPPQSMAYSRPSIAAVLLLLSLLLLLFTITVIKRCEGNTEEVVKIYSLGSFGGDGLGRG